MARPAKFTDRIGQRIKPARIGLIVRPAMAARIKAHCKREGVPVGDWLAALAVNALKQKET